MRGLEDGCVMSAKMTNAPSAPEIGGIDQFKWLIFFFIECILATKLFVISPFSPVYSPLGPSTSSGPGYQPTTPPLPDLTDSDSSSSQGDPLELPEDEIQRIAHTVDEMLEKFNKEQDKEK